MSEVEVFSGLVIVSSVPTALMSDGVFNNFIFLQWFIVMYKELVKETLLLWFCCDLYKKMLYLFVYEDFILKKKVATG